MKTSPINEKDLNSTEPADERLFKVKERQLGVWTLKVASQRWQFRKLWDEFLSVAPVYYRLAIDIFHISPYYFAIYLVCNVLDGLQESILLHQSNKLLRIIETGVGSGNPDGYAISSVLLSRIAFSFVFACITWGKEKYRGVLHSKVTGHFKLLLMKANLQLDLPTSQEQGSKHEGNAERAWSALNDLLSFLTTILRSGSQLAFIVQMSEATGGPVFLILSLLHPLAITYISRSLWNKVCYGYISDPDYQRIRALEKFADGTLRQDIITGGLAGWITEEFQKSHRNLGEKKTLHPYYQLDGESPGGLVTDAFMKLLEFAPTAFCAINVILNPHKFSITSLAILQQSSTALRYSLQMTLVRTQMLRRDIMSIHTIYRSTDVSNSMKIGTTPYPPPLSEDEKYLKGMSFQLTDVSFTYPGSQKTTSTALKDVSLSIHPGQLIVIVGTNGSGKSTLIRLLARLYDPSSGSIHIDGRPSASYIVSDLHEATALLSQDSKLYPLSLGENIGLGFPDKVHDEEMVREAARVGGADEFIEKLKDGMRTVLEPMLEVFQANLRQNKTHVLYKEMETLKKEINISGGEKQRVVAARSFMRFRSGKVKFVAVDEPSSALDAEAELKLFENLIKVREGKTMVFVTHRFGHLTRYADQIICMKDGSILEVGSHEELMAMKGEYANLYEIQAKAFAHDIPSEPTPFSSYRPLMV